MDMIESVQQLEIILAQDHAVKVAGIDADGILRGKVMSKSKFLSAAKGGFGFCSVIFGWDMHDRTYSRDLSISNADNGYRDMTAHIDLGSFRRIPWEHNIPFFLVNFHDSSTDKPIAPCPRSMIRTVASDYLQELDATPMAGAELEFYQYRETAHSVQDKQGVNLTSLTPGMFGYSVQRPTLNQDYYYDILDTCRKFKVELEGWHTETGPGVFEAAIGYSTAVEMADKASLFKLVCKSLGPKYDAMPCFMAKPQQGLPGNSGHLHVSLVDSDGNNLFARETADDSCQWKDLAHLSDIGRHFLAGVLAGLGDIMPLMAPTINSYKRLVESFWAPVTVSWGLEHRIASIRLISPPSCSPKATRFEIRTPGADVHSHYAMSAIFALGLRGIRQKLEIAVPPMGNDPNDYQNFEKLPKTLSDAAVRFSARTSLAREVLGDAFVDHYAATRYEEVAQFNDAVTNWEVTRYMETV